MLVEWGQENFTVDTSGECQPANKIKIREEGKEMRSNICFEGSTTDSP